MNRSMMKTLRTWTPRLAPAVLTAVLLLAGMPGALAAGKRSPGWIDSSPFIDAFGDEAVSVEVSLGGALLKTLCGIDPELKEMCGGLDSIYALILALEDSDKGDLARTMMRDTERKLVRDGWEILARVRDEDGEFKILTLSDGEAIEGLLVMGIEREGPSLVFANISGLLDLAAIAEIGEELDIPGLDRIGD